MLFSLYCQYRCKLTLKCRIYPRFPYPHPPPRQRKREYSQLRRPSEQLVHHSSGIEQRNDHRRPVDGEDPPPDAVQLPAEDAREEIEKDERRESLAIGADHKREVRLFEALQSGYDGIEDHIGPIDPDRDVQVVDADRHHLRVLREQRDERLGEKIGHRHAQGDHHESVAHHGAIDLAAALEVSRAVALGDQSEGGRGEADRRQHSDLVHPGHDAVGRDRRFAEGGDEIGDDEDPHRDGEHIEAGRKALREKRAEISGFGNEERPAFLAKDSPPGQHQAHIADSDDLDDDRRPSHAGKSHGRQAEPAEHEGRIEKTVEEKTDDEKIAESHRVAARAQDPAHHESEAEENRAPKDDVDIVGGDPEILALRAEQP